MEASQKSEVVPTDSWWFAGSSRVPRIWFDCTASAARGTRAMLSPSMWWMPSAPVEYHHDMREDDSHGQNCAKISFGIWLNDSISASALLTLTGPVLVKTIQDICTSWQERPVFFLERSYKLISTPWRVPCLEVCGSASKCLSAGNDVERRGLGFKQLEDVNSGKTWEGSLEALS